jgi:hypothetical protein
MGDCGAAVKEFLKARLGGDTVEANQRADERRLITKEKAQTDEVHGTSLPDGLSA